MFNRGNDTVVSSEVDYIRCNILKYIDDDKKEC